MQNHYTTLGVTVDTDEVVIKAAYRALCKKYHPDLCSDNEEDVATEQMKAINNAYDVLSDREKRAAYDRSLGSNIIYGEEDANRSFFPEHEESIETDWNFAINFYPKIESEYRHLKNISIDLAHAYKLTIVEFKLFDEHQETARSLENNYFKKYFGSNDRIKKLAKTYILEGNRAAAQELNKAVNFFGAGINSTIVCENILKTYPILDPDWQDETDNTKDDRTDNRQDSHFLGDIDLEEAGKLYENIRGDIIKWRSTILAITIMVMLVFILNPG